MANTALKRTLGLPTLVLYGLGNILGAGIYVLVGKVAGLAGTGTTMAFLLAMGAAAFTAFSYMELSSRYPVSASVSVYLHKAFGKRWLSVAIGLAMVGGGIASCAALAQGFAGYLNSLVTLPVSLVSVLLIAILGALTIWGIGESAKTASLFTVVEVIGLILVIWVGRSALGSVSANDVFAIDPVVGLSGVVSGAFLAFYAFIGFEDLANVSEEAKNPSRNMPLAILISLVLATVLYMLIVIVSTKIVSPSELANSSAPLNLVYEKSGAQLNGVLSYIGMAATLNGVIVQIIMGSRILYGLANQGWLNRKLAIIHKTRKTPVIATLLVVALTILATLTLPIVSLAQLTSLLILVVFTLVNVSLIKIKWHSHKSNDHQNVPLAVPYIGAILCASAVIYQISDYIS